MVAAPGEGGHPRQAAEDAAEVGGVAEVEAVGYLLDAEVGSLKH